MGLFKDLPVGSKIYLGVVPSWMNPFGNPDEPLLWTKVSDDGDLILVSNIGYDIFDEREPNNPGRDRRARGGNFFPESNIFQYLNSAENDWYAAAHEYDEPPRRYREVQNPGFMTTFSPFEKSLLESMQITCSVPSGFKKKYGHEITINCKVSLPSLSQLGVEREGGTEGRAWAGLPFLRAGRPIMTRTAAGSGIAAYIPGRCQVRTQSPYQVENLAPVVRLKPDVEIEDAPDEYGVFYISDTPLGMTLDSILGI